ncbi:TetR/AcrR family transcriptional regulator [Conyzicola nivalis]|uniref:TetR/AcrR family transcriptional regulator n=1 Tax=Conyzicola nivalis TaxID=1477021 RepID=UPI001E2B482F|nr:TetR/AcrR family transcriptional regulator [Conyzicola nivalis]
MNTDGNPAARADIVSLWTSPDPDTSVVRDRILNAASRLFYANGIRATGIAEVVHLAEVTKVTLYRHFASKDALVLAYLARRSAFEHEYMDEAMRIAKADPASASEAIASTIGVESCSPGFRGCPFINAAAEFGDPESEIRQYVDAHRAWFKTVVEDLLQSTGIVDVSEAATDLVMLRDGAMISGYLGDPDVVAASLLRAGTAVVAAHSRR